VKLAVGFRPGEPSDVPLIVSSWRKSYLNRDREGRAAYPLAHIPATVYFDGQSAIIARILGRASVQVAHAAEDPSHIIGWVCFEPAVLHYVYVTGMWRKDGLASELVGMNVGTGGQYTHHTYAMKTLGKRWRLRYNPYLAA
jgi:hypothetical protein